MFVCSFVGLSVSIITEKVMDELSGNFTTDKSRDKKQSITFRVIPSRFLKIYYKIRCHYHYHVQPRDGATHLY